MQAKINISGESHIIETLKQLGGVQAGKALRSSIMDLAKEVKKKFSADAVKKSGALSRSFGENARIFGQTGEAKAWIGVQNKYSEKGVLEKVEYEGKTGKKTRWRVSDKRPILYVRRINQSSKHAGWMNQTWNEEMPIILASLKDRVWKKIAAFARRRAKK